MLEKQTGLLNNDGKINTEYHMVIEEYPHVNTLTGLD